MSIFKRVFYVQFLLVWKNIMQFSSFHDKTLYWSLWQEPRFMPLTIFNLNLILLLLMKWKWNHFHFIYEKLEQRLDVPLWRFNDAHISSLHFRSFIRVKWHVAVIKSSVKQNQMIHHYIHISFEMLHKKGSAVTWLKYWWYGVKFFSIK